MLQQAPIMRLDQKIRALSEQPLFRVLQPEAVHVLAFSAQERSLKAGDELFRKGETSDGGFFVLSGRLAVDVAGLGLADEELGPGALIGEAALITETIRPATILALEPSRLLVLSRALMHRVLDAHPGSADALRRHVGGLLAETEVGLRSLT